MRLLDGANLGHGLYHDYQVRNVILSKQRIGARRPENRRARLWPLRLAAECRGTLLMETTVLLSVFGLLGATAMLAVQTSQIAERQFETHSLAENLIRNQMEYMFEQAYVPPPGVYLTVTPPPSYVLTAQAVVYAATSTSIERVRVTVFKEGRQVKLLETLRSNR